ncbi:hypothetical protein CGLO_18178 [Colletotrichum gloeosporioides Cg-14]|nr:hypothetical protein CGLO_18178 [Colletotrichum gloeosporioides Cg-14]
MLVSFC